MVWGHCRYNVRGPSRRPMGAGKEGGGCRWRIISFFFLWHLCASSCWNFNECLLFFVVSCYSLSMCTSREYEPMFRGHGIVVMTRGYIFQVHGIIINSAVSLQRPLWIHMTVTVCCVGFHSLQKISLKIVLIILDANLFEYEPHCRNYGETAKRARWWGWYTLPSHKWWRFTEKDVVLI